MTAVVSNVRAVSVKGTEVALAWDAPDDAYINDIATYEVKYFEKGSERNSSTLLTNKEEATILGLKHKTDYGFQVSASSFCSRDCCRGARHGLDARARYIYRREMLVTSFPGLPEPLVLVPSDKYTLPVNEPASQ